MKRRWWFLRLVQWAISHHHRTYELRRVGGSTRPYLVVQDTRVRGLAYWRWQGPFRLARRLEHRLMDWAP